MDLDAMPPCLLAPLARLGAASVEVTGPAGVRDMLRQAGRGELDGDLAEALGRDIDRLAVLLAG